MKLDAIFDRSHALTRRGLAGLLLLPAAAVARNRYGRDDDDFDDDYYDDDFRRGDPRYGYARRGGYSRVWRARPSNNYEPYRRDGRFDLRAIVDGAAEFAIRGDEVTWHVFSGGAPRNAGCEFRKEMPRGELFGLRLDQRDGRARMQIVETPSPRNGWALVVAVHDHKGGDDRYHARITWESDSAFEQGGRYGYERSRGPYDRDPYGRGRY